MKAEDCKIGMEVYPEGDRNSIYKIRVIPDADGFVILKWASDWDMPDDVYDDEHNGYDIVHARDLIPVDRPSDAVKAASIQKEIDKAKNSFEKAFKALEIATALADKMGTDLSSLDHEGLIIMKSLVDLIDKNGWSSSSLWC